MGLFSAFLFGANSVMVRNFVFRLDQLLQLPAADLSSLRRGSGGPGEAAPKLDLVVMRHEDVAPFGQLLTVRKIGSGEEVTFHESEVWEKIPSLSVAKGGEVSQEMKEEGMRLFDLYLAKRERRSRD